MTSVKTETNWSFKSRFENINVEYADQKGILVYNTPGRNADAVADFTIGMMIAECRNIARDIWD